MKKETFYILLLVIIAVTSYFGYNFFVQQKDFQQKQKCHDEAITYIANKQTTFEKQIKYDNNTQSTALILDGYNKSLNSCLVIWALNTKEDAVKYPSTGDSYTEYIDDALTGKNLAFWYQYYDSQTHDETSSGGEINGKNDINRNDFNTEIDSLFGKNSGGYIQARISPIPTSTNGYFPADTPTPTPVTQYVAPSVDMPPGCDTTINAYMKLGYSRSMTNQMLKSARPECSY
jgi:hypothetical protein